MVAIDKPRLAEIMRKNRGVLGTVSTWVDDATYENSIFHYGLPRHIRPFINQAIGDEPTYSDLIAYFASLLKSPIRYFEIGVSLGKNFFQMLHQLRDADLVGLDIEDINPVLEGVLEKRSVVEWPTMLGSLRETPSRLTEYRFASNANRVRYIAGDVFDSDTWARLKGEKFNLIFSDAYHSADAILGEWQRIKELALLDEREFAIIWDDLDTPDMQAAFGAIAREMQSLYGIRSEECGIGRARGWIGPYEPAHGVGLVYKLGAG